MTLPSTGRAAEAGAEAGGTDSGQQLRRATACAAAAEADTETEAEAEAGAEL